MRRPLGAQISHMLKDRGVKVIFGIPGVHNQEMYRGIEEAGLQHVLARHEQGAGFMADGYARAIGRPGVAYVITGPGLCNIMTPMGQAYSDSVPMLVISSCLDETAARQGQLHQMKDQEAAAATVCDWSETARTAEAAYQLIDRAFLEFSIDRPRSKSISIPIKALEAAVEGYSRKPIPPDTPPPTAQGVAEAFKMLNEARRPIFIFGGGLKSNEHVGQVLAGFAAASFTTYAGRGLVADDAPLHFGATLARAESAAVLGQADCVVAVGTELSEVDLWRTELGNDATILRVDIDARSLCDEHRPQIAITSDAFNFIRLLADVLAGANGKSDWAPEEVAAAKSRWRAQTDAERPGIVPLCDALRAATPPETMFYSDMTQFAYVAKEVIPMDHPGHWHHPSGFGTLGYALPAAIGGAVGRPGLPTIAIAGDYGFQYTLQELGTAVELKLPLPIIVWDNTKLKEIEDSMVRAQIAPNAVSLQNPDFCKLAEAYGALSTAPRSLASFQTAIGDALKADRPTLIHITPETGLN